ncbi:hypothetical protein HK102_001180 [Quaeritorhiza haematococci]|nr:hypothetical protein HK102_001180 [Quaeritorhiza haematococci]
MQTQPATPRLRDQDIIPPWRILDTPVQVVLADPQPRDSQPIAHSENTSPENATQSTQQNGSSSSSSSPSATTSTPETQTTTTPNTTSQQPTRTTEYTWSQRFLFLSSALLALSISLTITAIVLPQWAADRYYDMGLFKICPRGSASINNNSSSSTMLSYTNFTLASSSSAGQQCISLTDLCERRASNSPNPALFPLSLSECVYIRTAIGILILHLLALLFSFTCTQFAQWKLSSLDKALKWAGFATTCLFLSGLLRFVAFCLIVSVYTTPRSTLSPGVPLSTNTAPLLPLSYPVLSLSSFLDIARICVDILAITFLLQGTRMAYRWKAIRTMALAQHTGQEDGTAFANGIPAFLVIKSVPPLPRYQEVDENAITVMPRSPPPQYSIAPGSSMASSSAAVGV